MLHEAHEQGTLFALLIDFVLVVNMLHFTLHQTSRTLFYFKIFLHEYIIQNARGLNHWINEKTGLGNPVVGSDDYWEVREFNGLMQDIDRSLKVVAHMSHLCLIVAGIVWGFGFDVERGTVRMCILCSCMTILVYAMVEAHVFHRLNQGRAVREFFNGSARRASDPFTG